MNRKTLSEYVRKSKSVKDMQFHLRADNKKVDIDNDGFGKYVITITFVKKKIDVVCVKVIIDAHTYDHKVDYNTLQESFLANYGFIQSYSDFVYKILYDYKMIVAKCIECKHCSIVGNELSQQYKCEYGKDVVINHVKENCVHYNRRGSRLKKIQKSVITAIDLFGEENLTVI